MRDRRPPSRGGCCGWRLSGRSALGLSVFYLHLGRARQAALLRDLDRKWGSRDGCARGSPPWPNALPQGSGSGGQATHCLFGQPMARSLPLTPPTALFGPRGGDGSGQEDTHTAQTKPQHPSACSGFNDKWKTKHKTKTTSKPPKSSLSEKHKRLPSANAKQILIQTLNPPVAVTGADCWRLQVRPQSWSTEAALGPGATLPRDLERTRRYLRGEGTAQPSGPVAHRPPHS